MELKHFCLQYPDWVERYNLLSITPIIKSTSPLVLESPVDNCIADPTGKQALRLERYWRKIEMVKNAAHDADDELADYILIHATQGKTYDYICMNIEQIPCCREVFYKKCRRFYWILSIYRD